MIAVSSDGGSMVWTPDRGMAFVSTDFGASWTQCAGLPRGAAPIADRVDPKRFYALDGSSGTLLTSDNGGQSFQSSATGLPRGGGKLSAVSGIAGDIWLAAGDSGLFHSTDYGAHFIHIAGPDTAETIGSGRAAPGSDYPALFMVGKIAGIHGIYRSDDAGASWARINDDQHRYGWIGQQVIGDPRVYGRIYVATNGRGIVLGEPAK